MLPCWRVLSSVSILVASTRRSAVNTRNIRTPISIRLFRSIRYDMRIDACVCFDWRLFQGGRNGGPPWKLEKLKCVFNYFDRIAEKSEKTTVVSVADLHRATVLVPNGVITFRRYQLPKTCLPKWSESTEPLCPVHITKNKAIEDIDGLLQVKRLFRQSMNDVVRLTRWISPINTLYVIDGGPEKRSTFFYP